VKKKVREFRVDDVNKDANKDAGPGPRVQIIVSLTIETRWRISHDLFG